MKIKLFYIHPANYGNLMMACVFMKNFYELQVNNKKELPEFYLDVLDDDELLRVKKSLPEEIIVYREDLYNRKRRGILGKLSKLVNIPREIYYNKKTYDACIVLGGDCISQYYSAQVFVSDMIKFRAISKKVPFYLLGQTMGPFSGYAVGLVKNSLKRCHIYVRDNDCYRYLKKHFGFKYLYEARDLAFLDIPFQDDEQIGDIVKQKYVGTSKYITVVASGANRQYTSDEEAYIREYLEIIKYIVMQTGYDVLLLAHVIHVQDSNDKMIIDKLAKVLENGYVEKKYLDKIHIADEMMMPYEARILIGGGSVTVTGRMHAAVSSINMGTIPVCLSYSVKFKGVIGDDFKLNDYIYQCRNDELWKNGDVHRQVIKMLEEVLENRKQLVDRIAHQLENVQRCAYSQISVINFTGK